MPDGYENKIEDLRTNKAKEKVGETSPKPDAAKLTKKGRLG